MIILFVLLISCLDLSLSWDPDAGLVHGYQEHALVTASGQNGDSGPHLAVDNDEDTFWESPWCSNCCATLSIDMKDIVPVGWFYIRSQQSTTWVPQIDVAVSTDNVTWTPAFSHPGGIWRGIIYPLGEDIQARFVRATGCTTSGGGKIQLKELHVFNKYGSWGRPRPDDYVNPVSFSSLVGVNGFWQWGGAPNSPSVYAAIVTNARNYENMAWDLNNPNQKLNFSHFPTGQGDGGSWLNWDQEYGQWRNGVQGGPGFAEIDVSIQFTNDGSFATNNWENPYQDGYNYGHEFAYHFGPTHGNGLVKYVECGNEPWNYPAPFYREVLAGFSAGAKAADPNMLVLPGAFQADTPEYSSQWQSYGGNYIGARVNESISVNIDIINTHAYSYQNGSLGDWVNATYPEDPRSTMNAIRNVVNFRDANMPGKPVFLTEWGWDGASQFDNPACFEDAYHKVCVSAEAKALYTMRGILKIARDGLERGYIFYYDNDNGYSPIYARSGLTSSQSTKFQKEPAYFAVSRFRDLFGKLHFMGVAAETNDGYAYLLGDSSNTPTYLVAWLATDANDTTTSTLTLTRTQKWSIDPSVSNYVYLAGLSQTTVPSSSVLKIAPDSYAVQVDKNLLAIPLSTSGGK